MHGSESAIVAVMLCGFALYGLISMLMDLRRGIYAVARAIWFAISTTTNTIAYHWRRWVADRERKRQARSDRLQATLINSQRDLTEALKYLMDQNAVLQAQLAAKP